MDYLKRLNDALDYIECNLDGEIEYKKAADLACCSVYYFQRIFSLITDVTLSEYIRRRRMTAAAFELQNSNVKIIELAIKYGYESADSFSRAFYNVHGILPSAARTSGALLKAFPRLSFQISIKGEVEMNYRIEKKEAFRIVGIRRCFKAPEESEIVVPAFWNELYQNGLYGQIASLSNGNPPGLHGFIEVLGEDEVAYTIASVSDKETPVGMSSQIIQASTWAIFECCGPVKTAMADAWKRIFTEWLPTSNYIYAETIDIECFPYPGNKWDEDFKFEVWIPIK